ncbi:hypothetical protein [Rufibacter sp. XAAS-G3-1]|uniref:hypothetical protein n=1 Tax=Rufibacter sp. XAAS-G3-1 TaxID=2729134 RepID=UPI0015E6CE54|nr:hypothetical protein [Rufibacter sp. XAAS-G3-1]
MRFSFLSGFGLLAITLALLTGCVSTKHAAPLGGCLVNFKAGDQLLMAEIPGISPYESAALYKILEKKASEAGVQPAYAVEQEMDLRLHQVKPTADTASLAALQKLGYAYYLRVQVEGKEAPESYTHTSAEERREADAALTPANFRKEEDVSKAQLTFSLYTTDERRLIYTLVTTTEMRALPIAENDGDLHTVNLSKASMAIQKAMTKGVKKLLESCR